MKRSPIKRKAGLKRTDKKKPRRKSYGTLKQEAWDEFSRFIRLRDSLATTGSLERCRCITCGRTVPTFKPIEGGVALQAGHAIDKRTNAILFDEDIVNGQCSFCNATYGGNGRYAEYGAEMVRRHGLEWWQEKIRTARLPSEKPWRSFFLEEVRDKYKAKADAIAAEYALGKEPK